MTVLFVVISCKSLAAGVRRRSTKNLVTRPCAIDLLSLTCYKSEFYWDWFSRAEAGASASASQWFQRGQASNHLFLMWKRDSGIAGKTLVNREKSTLDFLEELHMHTWLATGLMGRVIRSTAPS